MKKIFILLKLYSMILISYNIAEATDNVDNYQKQGSNCNSTISKESRLYQETSIYIKNFNIISVEDLSQKIQKNINGSLLIIDTRPSIDFNKYSIEDSLNLSAESIQTKNYWKEKEIYLIGGDKFDLPLLVVADRLHEAGFTNVKVVTGGINAWINKGLSVIGNPPNANQLIQLSPQDVWTSRKDSTTLYILDSDYERFSKFFDRSLVLNNISIKNLNKDIQNYQNLHPKIKLSKVYLLANSTNIDNLSISEFNRGSLYTVFLFNSKPIFLSNHIENFNKSLTAKEIGPKKPKCG